MVILTWTSMLLQEVLSWEVSCAKELWKGLVRQRSGRLWYCSNNFASVAQEDNGTRRCCAKQMMLQTKQRNDDAPKCVDVFFVKMKIWCSQKKSVGTRWWWSPSLLEMAQVGMTLIETMLLQRWLAMEQLGVLGYGDVPKKRMCLGSKVLYDSRKGLWRMKKVYRARSMVRGRGGSCAGILRWKGGC